MLRGILRSSETPQGIRMAFETSKLEHVGGVSRVIWDRPPVKAASTKLMTETLRAFDLLEKRAEKHCIVLTGAGRKAAVCRELSVVDPGHGMSLFKQSRSV